MGTIWDYSINNSHCISRDFLPNAMFGSRPQRSKEKTAALRHAFLKCWRRQRKTSSNWPKQHIRNRDSTVHTYIYIYISAIHLPIPHTNHEILGAPLVKLRRPSAKPWRKWVCPSKAHWDCFDGSHGTGKSDVCLHQTLRCSMFLPKFPWFSIGQFDIYIYLPHLSIISRWFTYEIFMDFPMTAGFLEDPGQKNHNIQLRNGRVTVWPPMGI